MNMLGSIGFTSLLDVLAPTIPGNPRDRQTYVAVKAPRVGVLSSEKTQAAPDAEIPEGVNPLVDPSQKPRGPIFMAAKRLLPAPVKEAIKPVLRMVHVLAPHTTPEFARKKRR